MSDLIGRRVQGKQCDVVGTVIGTANISTTMFDLWYKTKYGVYFHETFCYEDYGTGDILLVMTDEGMLEMFYEGEVDPF